MKEGKITQEEIVIQAAIGSIIAQQRAEDHVQALRENKTRIRDWATIGEGKKARLTKISRGFGGDNAFYETSSTCEGKTVIQEIIVAVGWALLASYNTTVLIDGDVVAEFDDSKYVQPHIALARLGYEVQGMVDFARTFTMKEEEAVTT